MSQADWLMLVWQSPGSVNFEKVVPRAGIARSTARQRQPHQGASSPIAVEPNPSGLLTNRQKGSR